MKSGHHLRSAQRKRLQRNAGAFIVVGLCQSQSYVCTIVCLTIDTSFARTEINTRPIFLGFKFSFDPVLVKRFGIQIHSFLLPSHIW